MSFILRRKGYTVVTADDGLEAIDKVKEESFDMVFMDIKMPLMNGLETYKRIKTIRPETMVTMMTAYAVEELVQEALQEGAYGVIYKPLDIEKMIGLIQEIRGKKQGALILVVDDDPRTHVTLKNILSKKGYKVGSASTGEEAITLVLKKVYEIIFIEMRLPTINGIETYLRIKEIDPRVVAIMMTSYRQEMADLVQEALNKSAYACLYKPLDIAEVLQLIEEISVISKARKKAIAQ